MSHDKRLHYMILIRTDSFPPEPDSADSRITSSQEKENQKSTRNWYHFIVGVHNSPGAIRHLQTKRSDTGLGLSIRIELAESRQGLERRSVDWRIRLLIVVIGLDRAQSPYCQD